ncbi:CCA tRNA nucleotidyltransferase [Lentilactobacillus laojiaonis]|uniref:CCA tRNA nucleotidyltransferase n=1 Tax=Lentilactobacillus laojiaonis TaxID=2883998 RepID=UPI001D0B995A|nr:CCA tRNA nucleotidyltransferase [Lentilactobacillus laojiaonis]UDM31593.1 CCA tRNA nucleotidyltransferase [Lentilactobacillus laojiaonis]
MQIKKLPDEFLEALPILKQIKQNNFEAYFVGGSVRDTILKLPIHDVDIATSAYPQEIKTIFNKTVDTGIEHGTVMILDHGNGYEVTTFRTESGYQDYRRPDQVKFVRSLIEDLQRRDFTINALAMDETGTVVDKFNGLNDLDNHLIRAVGDANERFNEDALRMMRAVRFASQLDFEISLETKDGIYHNAYLLEKIAIERIHVEFVKMMLGQAAAKGLKLIIDTKMIDYLPGLSDHSSQLELLSKLNIQLKNEVQVWGLIFKVLNFNYSEINHILKKWKTSNQIIDDVKLTVEILNQIIENQVNNAGLFNVGKTNLINAIEIAKVMELNFDADELIHQYDQLPIKTKKELQITGKDLMEQDIVKPGPKLGKILMELENLVIDEKLENNREALITAAKNMKDWN